MSDEIHSCSVFCARTACVSVREAALRGQIGVMADLLSEASAVVGLVEPESSDESMRFALLVDRMLAAERQVRLQSLEFALQNT
jgi:hypothetical protein